MGVLLKLSIFGLADLFFGNSAAAYARLFGVGEIIGTGYSSTVFLSSSMDIFFGDFFDFTAGELLTDFVLSTGFLSETR